MLIIGLTGGIGSGKSTVAALFAELGVPIIDSDMIARDVLTTNPTILEKLIAHFGTTILKAEQLDRTKLRSLIFENINEKKWLEDLLHPEIITEIKWRLNSLSQQENIPAYCIIIIPLLAEVLESKNLVDRVLVVDTDEAAQTIRTMQRDRLTAEETKKIIMSQASREQRLNIADDVIMNEQDKKTLKQQVLKLHQSYMELAQNKSRE